MGTLGTSCIKYVLFAFNLICALLGIAVLALGAMNLTVHLNELKSFNVFFNLPVILITIGAVIFVIAFCGCCGALLESRCMILTFAGLIVILFIVEIFGGLAIYFFYNEEALNEHLKNSMNNYATDKDIQKFWDVIHYDFHCCGVNSHLDWGGNIPSSCCRDIDVSDFCHSEQAYEDGCFDEMVKSFKIIAPIVFAVIGVFQLFAIMFAYCLAQRNNHQMV